jgi:phospholipid/cholesterol/gamma-HCH transport system substrate-binding protein
MALQDLTPQLRTRLSRMERSVGWFVFLATALLVLGFAYYLYHTAVQRGWFIPKITYSTGVNDATGLHVGDEVRLMGFNVGEITKVEANDPASTFGVTIFFNIKKPYYGYLWSDSSVKVSSDFLGNRFLEVTKGYAGIPTVEETNGEATGIMLSRVVHQYQKERLKAGASAIDIDHELHAMMATNNASLYTNLTSETYCWLHPDEAPALSDRLDALVNQIQTALPNILSLTNRINAVLDNTSQLTSNLNVVAQSVRPAVSNLADITATADTNLPATFDGINRSLDNLAGITSNLNAQVEANSNMLSTISKTIGDTDTFIQGLKHHWLLRSAFKTPKTNAPPAKASR